MTVSSKTFVSPSVEREASVELRRLRRLSRSGARLLAQTDMPGLFAAGWAEAQALTDVQGMVVWQKMPLGHIDSFGLDPQFDSQPLAMDCFDEMQPLYQKIEHGVEVFAVPLHDNTHATVGAILFWTHTTGLRDNGAQEALLILVEQIATTMWVLFGRAEAQLQLILDSIDDGIVMTDMLGNILVINTACRTLFRIEKPTQPATFVELFEHNPLIESATVTKTDDVQMLMRRIVEAAVPTEMTLFLQRHHDPRGTNTPREVLLRAEPILNCDKVRYVTLILRDMTRPRQEDRLRSYLLRQIEDERSKLDAIVESLSDGLIVTNTDDQIVFYNQQVERLLGITPPTLLGLRWLDATTYLSNLLQQPEETQQHIAKSLKLRAADEAYQYTLHLTDEREIRVTSFPVLSSEGQLMGIGSLLHDSTRERESDRLKSRFVSVASHELRTPLTGIVGFTELLLLREGQVTPDVQHTWLLNIHHEALRVSKIVGEMLDLSKIQSGTLTLNRQPLNLARVIDEAIRRVRQDAKAPLRVQLEQPEVAAQLVATGDNDKVLQILINIIDNALKYSPVHTTVTLCVSPITTEAGQPMVQVSVTDQGMGIAPNELPKLFTGFYRVRNEQTASIGGTGLGLSIVKNLVELHGGEVRVESQVGHGSTFFFTLPSYIEKQA